jgi:hypothetical protein
MSDVSENPYELSLKGPGITINKNLDAKVAAAIAQMAVGGFGGYTGPAQAAARPAAIKSTPALAGQPLSLREFLQQADVSAGIHAKILAVGRYLRDFEGQSDFARDDIRSRFRTAGEPQPANFPRDFQKSVRAGWIAEDPKAPGRFYVTRTGDEFIEKSFAPANAR